MSRALDEHNVSFGRTSPQSFQRFVLRIIPEALRGSHIGKTKHDNAARPPIALPDDYVSITDHVLSVVLANEGWNMT
jgi:hypothetical protein